MLATASWAGSEVEPPVEVKPDLLIVVDGGNIWYIDDGQDCVTTIAMTNDQDVTFNTATNCNGGN